MSKQNPVVNTHSISLTHYRADDGYRPWLIFGIVIAVAIGGVVYALAQEPASPGQAPPRTYEITALPSLGGNNSAGNSINNRDIVGGYSVLPSRQARHAVIWRDNTLLDLGTLGGPNSSIAWNVKNNRGILVGISQTATPQPLGEAWSSAAFYSGPFAVGFVNLGFAWENGQMRALPTLGGDNGYATGANNAGIAVGWAENT